MLAFTGAQWYTTLSVDHLQANTKFRFHCEALSSFFFFLFCSSLQYFGPKINDRPESTSTQMGTGDTNSVKQRQQQHHGSLLFLWLIQYLKINKRASHIQFSANKRKSI